MRRLLFGVFLGLFVIMIAACAASTASVSQVTMAHGYKDGSAVDPTTTFQPTDLVIHGVVTLANAPDDTKLKAVWTAVDAGGGQIKNQKITENEVTTGGTADFTITSKDPWPAGSYKMDLYMNDTLVKTVPFTVAGS